MNKKKYLSIAKDVINLEIKALQKLKKNINSSFNDAVLQIAKCQSKIILCGVGKSGLIASKIAATFASVGTPSFYISASEASHGELGMISKKIYLLLSVILVKLKNLKYYSICKQKQNNFNWHCFEKESILYRASDKKS